MASLHDYFLQGVAEFNQQRYFDCHETLEFLWNQLVDANERDYVQGILQVGVALYHYRHQNKVGYHQVLDKGRLRLTRLMKSDWKTSVGPTLLPQIDLEHFIMDMDAFVHERLGGWMPMLLLMPPLLK